MVYWLRVWLCRNGLTASVFEQFVEELLHGEPGAAVGSGVVGGAFGIVIAGGRIGEAVHGATVQD